MSGLHNGSDHNTGAAADLIGLNPSNNSRNSNSKGNPGQPDFVQKLDKGLAANDFDHNHAPPENTGISTHIDLKDVNVIKDFKVNRNEFSLSENVEGGDFLDPGKGNNVVIGSKGKDVIMARGRGINTITTGTDIDTIILGKETTNRILDFDPFKDRFVLEGINSDQVVIAQGKNPGKGGLAQPLDSVNNALVIDKQSGHILAALPFVKASDLNEGQFSRLQPDALRTLNNVKFDNVFKGSGKITGTRGSDSMIGGDGDDFLYVGDDGFKFETARGGGGTEFPFRTDSPGTSELTPELKDGVLRVNGRYQNFDGFPLFSQEETEIDPKAKILNGSDPKALVDGFLKVPNDVEGNKISGTHLHFSPSGDDRGNFADATVIRYFENTPIDAKSGTIKGEFELTPEEHAALLAGNLYVNIHTNIDGDKDDRAGFPTGENRLNLNKDVVKFV